MGELNLNTVRHALQVARDNGFAEVEISVGGSSFSALLDTSKPKSKPAPASSPDTSAEPSLIPIKSTSVGYFRNAKKPVVVGDAVSEGQVIATISALGLSYDIEATSAGWIAEIKISDGDPVEYGQVLATLSSTELGKS